MDDLADKLELTMLVEPFVRDLDAALREAGCTLWVTNPFDPRARPAVVLQHPSRAGWADAASLVAGVAHEHGCVVRTGRVGRQTLLQAVWPGTRYAATLATSRKRGVPARYEGFST